MKIIAICGYQKSGKSTTAKIIADEASKLEYVPYILSFGKRLREITADIFDISVTEFYDNKDISKIELCNHTPREAMIAIGEKARELVPNIWAYHVEKFISENEILQNHLQKRPIRKNKERIYIIEDLRNEYEYQMIKKYHGFVLKIERQKSIKPKTNDPYAYVETNHLSFEPDFVKRTEGALTTEQIKNIINNTNSYN